MNTKTRRGPGRPALSPEEKRSETVYYRLLPWERRALEVVADVQGKTMSDLTREIMVQNLWPAVKRLRAEEIVDRPGNL